MMPARFAQTNLGAVGFHREITLLDGATVEMPKIRRQSFQQEFPFDLTRDFAIAGLKVAGHDTIFSGPRGAGKPQPHRAATTSSRAKTPVRLGARDPSEVTSQTSQRDPSTTLGMTTYV